MSVAVMEPVAKKAFTIRIVAGLHEQLESDGQYHSYRPRRYVTRKIAGEVFEADPADWNGDIFVSSRNYASKWPEKFELVTAPRAAQATDRYEGESLKDFAIRMAMLAEKEAEKTQLPVAAEKDPEAGSFVLPVKTKEELQIRLQAMTLKALQDLAADEEINLGTATTKEQVVEVLAGIRY